MSVYEDGQDADLFMSVLDGRFPVSNDYDFASTNLGPDNIIINSNSTFFSNQGYNKSNGILIMVGVKAITSNVSYTLMMQGPYIYPINATVLVTGI